MVQLMRIALSLLSLLVLAIPSLAQGTLTGVVTNAKTGEIVGGASIRVAGTTRGTYSNGRGEFRLPLPDGASELVIRSLGYQQKTIKISETARQGAFALEPSSVGLDAVRVLGEITPEEVIKRASNKVEENADRISSLISNVYSKMRVRVDGMETVADPGANESITETFSTIYERRKPDQRKHVRILQRRQTKNVAAGENLLVFDQFFDFTLPEIRIMETRLVTPLSPDAPDEYAFTMLGKEPLGNLMVYRIAFEPKARIYPGFEGTLSIVEGTYQVIEAAFSPTDETAFPFLKDINYTQRFERVSDSIWVPMYQEITGSAGVMVLAGILELEGKMAIETWVTDVQVNVPIADSLLEDPDSTAGRSVVTETGGVRVRMRQRDRITSVAPDADSSRTEFWEAHAFAQQSDDEKEAYRIADSIAAAAPPAKDDEGPGRVSVGMINIGPVGIDAVPVLDRTSITGWAIGAELEFQYDRFALTTMGTIGDRSVLNGEVGLDIGLVSERGLRLAVNGSVFSRVETIQPGRTVFGRVNFLNLSNLLYAYWSDFYRADGFDLGLSGRASSVRFALTGTWSRHFNMPIIDGPPSREVVRADAGEYQTLAANVSIAKPSFFAELFGGGSPVYGEVTAMIGRETNTDASFATVEAILNIRQETFATGYYPMRLDVDLMGGTSFMDALPRQYQFTLVQRFPAIGGHTAMATVPVNAFGGTEYARAHVEHNFTDIWWRAIGIPTFSNKRGIDLIGVVDVAQMWQDQSPVTPGATWDATNGWYAEAGFALGRIPTFVSDLFFLRFDALWPVGGLQQRGTFGWSITLSSPLM